MDQVNQYSQIVRDLLENFAADDPEAQLIFDTERVGLCPAAGIAISSCTMAGAANTVLTYIKKNLKLLTVKSTYEDAYYEQRRTTTRILARTLFGSAR